MSPGWGVLPLRAVVGLVFVVHGTQKLLGFGLAGTAGLLGSLGIPLPGAAAVHQPRANPLDPRFDRVLSPPA